MIAYHDGSDRAARAPRSKRRHVPLVALGLTLPLAACDSLLEVTMPGSLEESALDNPLLASTLVLGAQSDFDCALNAWIRGTGLWTGELYNGSTALASGATEARRALVEQYGSFECTTVPALWLPFQIARVQAESAIQRIESFPAESVPNRDYLIATASAYAGYSYQHLGEGFCELYFDRGPRVTREETYRLAEARFTAALEYAERVVSGPDATNARAIANMARIGRARARLFLGDGPGVLADAGAVDSGFVRQTDHSSLTNRRRNNVYQDNNVSRSLSAATKDYQLTVDGVPDPRVPVTLSPLRGSAGRTDHYLQSKYTSLNASIPVASWREAQLMIAEVVGGSTAVDVINGLRATRGLPAFSSTDPEEIRNVLVEERRRELYLEGKLLGDMLRLGLPFPTGFTPGGESIDTSTPTCLPTMAAERLGNPNAR